jgi:hypothetical protein
MSFRAPSAAGQVASAAGSPVGPRRTEIGGLQQRHEWPSLAAIQKLARRRDIAAATTTEIACYLVGAASRHSGGSRVIEGNC